MKIFSDKSKNNEIYSVEQWFKNCPPANPSRQWCDKRSAKEMANFWTDQSQQENFLMFLRKINNEIKLEYAIPEFANIFDNYKNPRKNDLCIFAKDENNEIFISIEGKSDEHFGENYAGEEWIKSIYEKTLKEKSKKLDRIIGLYQRYNYNSKFLRLRYQLTYWLAGAIDEAIRNNVDTVFLIVQEFHSNITNEKKILKNQNDLDFFINFLADSNFTGVGQNEIIGPINNHFTKNINVYIGKFKTVLK